MRLLEFPVPLLALVLASACSSTASRRGPATGSTDTSQRATDEHFVLSEAMPPRVYRNGSGISLTMVFLESAADEPRKALVRFTGLPYPTAGKVMLATAKRGLHSHHWKIRYDGKDHTLVSTSLIGSKSSEARVLVRLHMPKAVGPVGLEYHEAATERFEVDAFIATHRRHRDDGSLLAFAELDRDQYKEKIMDWLAVGHKHMVSECGQAIPYRVDWESIDIGHDARRTACPTMFHAASAACKRDNYSRARFLEEVRSMRCSHSEENEFRLQADGTLQMNIRSDSPMQGDVVKKKIYELLGLGDAVLETSDGGILVFDPDDPYWAGKGYFGDENDLFALRGHANVLGAWDPYASGAASRVYFRDRAWTVACSKGPRTLTEVSTERRKKILDGAKRHSSRWKREEFALARDNRGNYYYVDRHAEEFGGKNYRVFRGPRGQLTETTLVDIVDDSDGRIFATKRGQLRLVLGQDGTKDALWIEGKKRHKLVVLHVHENLELIYSGLGVYDSETMGTVCE